MFFKFHSGLVIRTGRIRILKLFCPYNGVFFWLNLDVKNNTLAHSSLFNSKVLSSSSQLKG